MRTKQAIHPTPPETTWDGQRVAQIVRQAKVLDPFALRAKERALAGTYRVIHGTLELPNPEFVPTPLDAYGLEGPSRVPKTIVARMGDEVALGDEDAARMLDADVVEALDAEPSRLGKVWEPPRVLGDVDARSARSVPKARRA